MKERFLLFSVFLLATASLSCKKRSFNSGTSTASDDYSAWERERELRQKAFAAYILGEGEQSGAECQYVEALCANEGGSARRKGLFNTLFSNRRRDKKIDMREAFIWFRDVPVGKSGLPLLTYRLVTSNSPREGDDWSQRLAEVWGPGEQMMSNIGLGPHPDHTDYPVPFGLGWTLGKAVPPIHIGSLTCAACHVGRVVGPENRVLMLYGAPNTQFDAHGFTSQVTKTILSEHFTSQNLKAALAKASQEPNWLYGKDRKNHVLAQVSETTFFQLNADKVVDGMKAQSLKRSTRVAHFLAEGPYKNNPSANIAGGNPGRLDPFSTAIALLSDPNVVKKSVVSEKPSMVDIMSVWNQSKRATAQWDGGIRVEMMRNLGAELGVIGDPEEVSLKNAELSTELLRDLPPPAYPFKISESLRSRGEVLFKENCAGCHYDNNETVYPVSVVGTDPNRASLITDSGRTALIKALRQACGKSEACKGIEDKDIIRPTGQSVGYVAHPLDGIWARAPYLHNGSVPTLMHLLVPRLRQEENAREFWRGNISYDQDWVGFEWRNSQAPQGFSENQSSSNKAFVDEKGNFLAARLYKVGDESLGTSNRGHESGIFLKRSWSEDFSTPEGQDTRALLEYLKTL